MSSSPRRPIKLIEGVITKALGDPDTPGLVLFTIVLHTFGDEVLGDPDQGIEAMDPAVMWAGLHDRYNTWVTEEGENKLNALITGLTDGMFWRDSDVFMSVATALFDGDLGDIIDVGFEELSAAEIMWAILEMELAWDSDDVPEFSLDVQQYVDKVLSLEQEDHDQNADEIEKAYLIMMEQLRQLGIPASMLRAWDEEYAQIAENLADSSFG